MGATLTVAGYSPLELGSGMPNRLRPPVGGRLFAESWSIGPTRDGQRPANGSLAGGCGSEAPKARPTGSTNRQKPQHVPTPHSGQLLPSFVMAVIITFVLGLLAARRHLRPLVGYLLAGVAIGPFTPGFVGDTGLAQQFVEIGVILLMFEVGLHLSVADLATVRPIAVWGALAQIAVSVPAGVGLALAWGWTTAAGSLLGLASSVASTVVIPCHPSVQPRGPQRRWGEEPLQAGLEAADAAPEQGGQAAAEVAGLSIRDFFSSGVAPWAVSHIPVETAQNSASAMTRISRSRRSERRRWLASRPKPRVLKSENMASIPHLRP